LVPAANAALVALMQKECGGDNLDGQSHGPLLPI